MSKNWLFLFIILFVGLSSQAQLSENFLDGDFTTNPTWSGDNTLFTITAGELNSQSPTAANYYLSTPSTLATNAEFIFDVNLKFATSGSNYVDVFLLSDVDTLTNPQNGYFVRIGSTQDDIKLYKIVGGAETLLIDGADGSVNSSTNNPFRIKVTRDATDLWTLYYDDGILGSFLNAGNTVDNAVNSSAFFGVKIIQSIAASAINNHFFDNFSVGVIGADVTPPNIVSVTVIDANNIDVFYSETIELATSQNLTNYSVDNGIGNPSVAARDLTDSTLVHLTFATAFGNGILNTLTVNNVQDLSGNAIINATKTFTYAVVVVPNYRDVVINEIFADPTPQVGLPGAEFVELYNPSANPYNLVGWKFINTTTVKVLPNFILAPNSYVILCNSTDTALFSSYGSVIGISSFSALTNGGDSLTLMDNNNNLLDEVAYDISWYQDALKSDGGWTLELINPLNACGGALNWISSMSLDGGTPGTQNSVYDISPDVTAPQISSVVVNSLSQITVNFNETMDSTSLANAVVTISNGISVVSVVVQSKPNKIVLNVTPNLDSATVYTIQLLTPTDCTGNGLNPTTATFGIGAAPMPFDVVINEIFADPDPQVGLPGAEFVELYNPSAKAYNLSDWKFVNTPTIKTLPSFILAPNTYVILCDVNDTALFSPYGNVIGVSSFSALTNGGDSLTLMDNNNNLLDAVAYDISWYQDAAKELGGWSLELINPTNACGGALNWIASISLDGGTPSTQNSVYDISPDVTAPQIASVVINSLTQLTVNFNETMDSTSLANAVVTISNGISVVSVVVQSKPNKIVLNVTPNLDSATVYTIQLLTPTDCNGNGLNPTTATFGIGAAPMPFDVVINEIFADPDPSMGLPPLYEYLELYNKSTKIIDLSGLKVADPLATSGFLSGKLLPNEYIIICSSSAVSQFTPYGKVFGASSFPSLNNADDEIKLVNALGEIIHQVNYFDTWYNDEVKKDGGWSLEMIDPNNPCGESSNWIASTKWFGGTPGTQNTVFGSNPDNNSPTLINAVALNDSTVQVTFDETLFLGTITVNNGIFISSIVPINGKTYTLNLSAKLIFQTTYTVTATGVSDCVGNTGNSTFSFSLPEQGNVGDIVINEVLFNPFTGGSDFVEIYNNSTKYINLQNWELANFDNDSISNRKIITTDPYVLLPKQFLVLTKDAANIKQEYLNAKEDRMLQMSTLPTYNIDEGNVYLVNNLNQVVDNFSYNEKMHFALLNDVKGVSLERIDYNRLTSDNTNWHSAAEDVGFATPGYENSQYQKVEITDEISISPETFSPDNDGIDDVVNISYQFAEAGYVANIVLYDAKGRLIKNLLLNELLGTKGTFSWDGINENNEKAAIGIYIIYFEAFQLNGDTKKFKKTCVLGGHL